MKLDYEKQLNAAQLKAVKAGEGAYLVVAGAGTGKTRTLIYRLAYLVESGVNPQSILLLTFTRKAAQQMLKRASKILDERCKKVEGGTFHGFANKLLRKYAPHVGYKNNYTILDAQDAKDLLGVIRNNTPHKTDVAFPKKNVLYEVISKVVNKYQKVGEILQEEYPTYLELEADIKKIASNYIAYKRKHNLMDYDDLLVNLRNLLDQNPVIRRRLSRKYEYVMVDEYQDTNKIQAQIAALLSAEHGNIMVVGDDCQSIYRFRGAQWENIMNFKDIFPQAQIIKLEQNYRSTQPILDYTNSVISAMQEKHEKKLYTETKQGVKPLYLEFESQDQEASHVADEVLTLREAGEELGDAAVLYRANYNANLLEEELNARKIPYQKYGGLKFAERAHVKDVLAHLNCIQNPQDEFSMHRVLKLFEGIGPKGAQKITEKISEDGLEYLASKKHKDKTYERDLRGLFVLFNNMGKQKDPVSKISLAIDYYLPRLKSLHPQTHVERARDLESLLAIAARFPSLESFLSHLAIEPPSVTKSRQAQKGEEPLTLSTIHSAKGLEWKNVFLIQLNDGVLPHKFSLGRKEELNEEHRLFYVACTRAKKRLTLTRPMTRVSHFLGKKMILTQSRFIEDEAIGVLLDHRIPEVGKLNEEEQEVLGRINAHFKPANEFLP